jgi:hypothetical protein
MARKYEELPVEQNSSEFEIQKLQRLYNFINPVELTAYIKRYPFLIISLQEAYQKITGYFEHSQLTLERTSEPEDSSHCRMLLTIHPLEDANNVLALYKQMDVWYIEFSKQVKGHICLDIEHSSLNTEENAWDILFKYAGTYEGPENWSAEHNHYLYGTPKHPKPVNNA